MSPIELRQRSPLGAVYRSPLGAFGPGVEEEPEPVFTGIVTNNILISWPGGGRTYFSGNHPTDPTCGVNRTGGVNGAPTTEGWAIIFTIDYQSPLFPEYAQYSQWRIVGETSGASLPLSDIVQEPRCRQAALDVAWNLSTWLNPINSNVTPDGSVKVSNLAGDDIIVDVRSYAAYPFIEGETVTVVTE